LLFACIPAGSFQIIVLGNDILGGSGKEAKDKISREQDICDSYFPNIAFMLRSYRFGYFA
jgi:hypothetical protein